jgi:hypothetical protein
MFSTQSIFRFQMSKNITAYKYSKRENTNHLQFTNKETDWNSCWRILLSKSFALPNRKFTPTGKKNPHIQFYWKPHFIAFHAWIKRSEKHFHMISYTSRQEPLNWNLHHLRNFSSRITKDLCSPSTPIHTMPHSFRQNCQPTACTDYNEIEKLPTNPGAIKQCHYCQLVSTRNPFQYINSMTFSIVSYFTCLHS